MKDILNSTPFNKERALKSVKEEFNKNMLNDDFKNMVMSLNLPMEYLAKYTSKLNASLAELSACKGCKGLTMCKNNIYGYVYYPSNVNNMLVFSHVACRFQKEKIKKTEKYKNIYLFDEPKEMKEATIQDIDSSDKKRHDAIKWITAFVKKYKEDKKQKGLYLHGSFGGGKTYLIAALFNELAASGKNAALVYYPEFLRKLKASFDNGFSTNYEKVKKSDLLLLDDIGAETTTNWNRDEILGPILQYRMQEGLPTFFTSNLTLAELESHFKITKDSNDSLKARRIMERIKYLTEDIEMICENRRK